MIEWRFGLPPLTVRDQTANNLAEVLNLAVADVSAPAFNVPNGPFGTPCVGLTSDSEAKEWTQNLQQLKIKALASGFPGVQ
jgi:phospholipase C